LYGPYFFLKNVLVFENFYIFASETFVRNDSFKIVWFGVCISNYKKSSKSRTQFRGFFMPIPEQAIAGITWRVTMLRVNAVVRSSKCNINKPFK
jgi:hypothetical protein